VSAHRLVLAALGGGVVRVDVYCAAPGHEHSVIYDGGLALDPADENVCREAARWLHAILGVDPRRVRRLLDHAYARSAA
jgi:hypothetical protein